MEAGQDRCSGQEARRKGAEADDHRIRLRTKARQQCRQNKQTGMWHDTGECCRREAGRCCRQTERRHGQAGRKWRQEERQQKQAKRSGKTEGTEGQSSTGGGGMQRGEGRDPETRRERR